MRCRYRDTGNRKLRFEIDSGEVWEENQTEEEHSNTGGKQNMENIGEQEGESDNKTQVYLSTK